VEENKMIWFTLFAVPVVVALFAFLFGKSITLKELLAQMIAVLFVGGIMAIGLQYNSEGTATETWNGQIKSKHIDKESCSHSYKCHCYTTCSGSGSKRSCTEHCSTCYEHSYDNAYYAESNIGERFEIDTIDRQGLKIPPRYSEIEVGEPVVVLNTYKNHIRASGDSLFYKKGFTEKFKGNLPTYPGKVFDYWKLNRILTVNVSIPDREKAETLLSEFNGNIGKKKQCNMILVVVRNQPMEYTDALWEYWKGANKNDAVLIVSLDDNYGIQWVNTIALTKSSMYGIQVRDGISSLKTFEPMQIISTFASITEQYYERRPMKDFEYLLDGLKPSPGAFTTCLIIILLLSIGMSVYAHKIDIFDEEN